MSEEIILPKKEDIISNIVHNININDEDIKEIEESLYTHITAVVNAAVFVSENEKDIIIKSTIVNFIKYFYSNKIILLTKNPNYLNSHIDYVDTFYNYFFLNYTSYLDPYDTDSFNNSIREVIIQSIASFNEELDTQFKDNISIENVNSQNVTLENLKIDDYLQNVLLQFQTLINFQ